MKEEYFEIFDTAELEELRQQNIKLTTQVERYREALTTIRRVSNEGLCDRNPEYFRSIIYLSNKILEEGE